MLCIALGLEEGRRSADPISTSDKMDRLAVPQHPSLSLSSSSLLSPPSRTPSYRRSVTLPRRQAERPPRRSTISAVLALGRRASLSRFLSEQREMRATVRMAIIIAFFCGMWVGFFVVYVVSGWCPSTTCPVPRPSLCLSSPRIFSQSYPVSLSTTGTCPVL